MNLRAFKLIGSRRPPVAALVFALGATLVSSAGCSEGACFQWTATEGVCPAQADALTFFEEPTCHFSDIKTVDSDGEFEDNACCYAVTKYDDNDERFFTCDGSSAGVGVTVGGGGFGGGGVGGAPGVGGGPQVASSSGVGGGTSMCVGCAEAMTSGSTEELCPASKELYDAFQACACNGPCASVCSDSCAAMMPSQSQACSDCLADPMAGCGEPFAACANDVP